MSNRLLIICALLAVNVNIIYGYKILLFVPGVSDGQLLLYSRIANLLVKSGHDVVYYYSPLNPAMKTPTTKTARIFKVTQ